MANKFNISKTKSDHGVSDAGLRAPSARPDWDEKTISSWSDHSSFLENSRVVKLAPPPRMIARPPVEVPIASAPVTSRPWLRYSLMVIVLIVSACGGLYANGLLDPLLSSAFGSADSASTAPAPKPKIQKRNASAPAAASQPAPQAQPQTAPQTSQAASPPTTQPMAQPASQAESQPVAPATPPTPATPATNPAAAKPASPNPPAATLTSQPAVASAPAGAPPASAHPQPPANSQLSAPAH